MTSVTFEAGGSLKGTLRVPGDKSISHRAFLLAAIANGHTRLSGFSLGDDVRRTRSAIEAMGAVVTEDGDGVVVQGGRSRLHEPEGPIDLGNSGTGMRLMSGWCASMPWQTTLTGDASLTKRPMWRIVEPLRRMGAVIDGADEGRRPPLAIRGGTLHGIEFESPLGQAQPKSAVLLAGLVAEGETVVHEQVAARMHTEEMLSEYGADITTEEKNDGSVHTRLRPSEIRPFALDIPGDPSQAAFWIVAACIVPGSDVTIENVYVGHARAGAIEVLMRMGADIELNHRDANTADVRVRHSELTGTDIGGDEIPSLIDELPILSIAAAVANGTTVVTDAKEMRVKESDRIAAVAREVGGLGVSVEEREDGFVVEGRPGTLSGGNVNAHLDHRIAMTGAIAALISEKPVTIEGWDSVDTSYPAFTDDLAHLRN